MVSETPKANARLGTSKMELSLLRLYSLRALYLFIALGLMLSLWADTIASMGVSSDSYTVIGAMLVTMSLLSLLGVRYPIKMLPVLLFELLWKVIWLLGFSLPAYLNGSLDDYAMGTTFACAIGVILTPLAIPWGYVSKEYISSKGERWR